MFIVCRPYSILFGVLFIIYSNFFDNAHMWFEQPIHNRTQRQRQQKKNTKKPFTVNSSQKCAFFECVASLLKTKFKTLLAELSSQKNTIRHTSFIIYNIFMPYKLSLCFKQGRKNVSFTCNVFSSWLRVFLCFIAIFSIASFLLFFLWKQKTFLSTYKKTYVHSSHYVVTLKCHTFIDKRTEETRWNSIETR